MGYPVQIISTGEGEENLFNFHEENLQEILAKVPSGMKVAVLSVVGAFRSGKSFLLTFFLRYLRHGSDEDISEAWMTKDGGALAEGNLNTSADSEGGFAWRGGQERQTTGMWMWSEPFIRRVSRCSEDIAILLMDTQGLFDNDTTMALTTQIFGMSTLISSYQIYNVDKKIQEDHLQHLALFSEYGRMALEGSKSDNDEVSSAVEEKPFQRIEFLVRDWQNFDADLDAAVSDDEKAEACRILRKEMTDYLATVIRPRDAADLASTRDQITRCFEKVDCFLLPHPGFAVIKKNFDGDISKIEHSFRALLNYYVRMIFDHMIEPKTINNREITAPELLTFMRVYTQMFQEGEGTFPRAMTMLEATADANNRNAYDLSFGEYKSAMNRIAGPNASYVKDAKLLECHNAASKKAFHDFDHMATMGSRTAIEIKKDELVRNIEAERERYFEENHLRNPYRDMEFFIIPLVIAAMSWLAAVIVDKTCSTDFCEAAEDGFQNIYLFILFGVALISWRGSFEYVKDLLQLLGKGGLAKLKEHQS